MSISIETAQEIIAWYENTMMNVSEYAGDWMKEDDHEWDYDPILAKLAENLQEECHEKVYAKVCIKSMLEAVGTIDLEHSVHDEDPLWSILAVGVGAAAKQLEYTWTEEDNKAARETAEADFEQMYETASMLGLMDRVERGQMCAKDSVLIGTIDADSYERLYKRVQEVARVQGKSFNGTLEDVIRASHYDPDSDTTSVLTSVAAFTRKRKAA